MEAGNPIRALLWFGAILLSAASWLSPPDTLLNQMLPDFISISIAIIVIDELVQYRDGLKEKKKEKQQILRQLGSKSNAHALEAARIIREERWDRDGSLNNIELEWADLNNVQFLLAKLSNATIHHSTMQNALLHLSNLDNTKFIQCNLDGIDLLSASLLHAEFHSVNISRARLVNIKAKGIKFHGVILEETSLKSADLEGADFLLVRLKNADLARANLKGANLKTVTEIETANLKETLYNCNTHFPDGFNPEAAGAIKVEG